MSDIGGSLHARTRSTPDVVLHTLANLSQARHAAALSLDFQALAFSNTVRTNSTPKISPKKEQVPP